MVGGAANNTELVAMLKARCEGHGASRIFAHQAGVTESLVSQILNGKQKMGPKVAKALGYRRVVRWEPLQAD